MADKVKLDEIGFQHGPMYMDYSWRRLALYALSVGANVEGELDYVYEKNIKAIPTFWAAILGLPEFMGCYDFGQSLPDTLHYGFRIDFHKPILKDEGRLKYTVTINDVFDRGEGRGALAEIKGEGFDGDTKAFTLYTYDIDMSKGGFDGKPAPKMNVDYPDREPDVVVEDYIGPNQAAIYRIDNDNNILHIDPEFAKLGGFDRPILMGMCTAGYACRALLKTLMPGKPDMMKSLAVRFVSPIEPGTKIKTLIWKIDDHHAVFRLMNAETDTKVLNHCSVEF